MTVRGAGILAATAAAVLWAAPAWAAPQVNGVYDVSEKPGQLAVGPDGAVWVALETKLARITPAGVVTEFDPPDVGSPKGIVAGPDGNLWTTETGAVVKVSPASPTTTEKTPIAAIGQPQEIVAGPDGNLWTASADKLIRIPPAAPNTATATTVAPDATALNARGIAFAGGALWIADFGTPRLVSVSPDGVQQKAYPVAQGMWDVAAGAGGQVAGTIQANNPRGVARVVAGGTPQETAVAGSDPSGIAFGADGAYWFADFLGNRLGRLDAATGAVTLLGGLPAGGGAREITAGPGNTLWVSVENVNKVVRVTGVDPPAPPPGGGGGGGGGGDTVEPAVSGARFTASAFRRSSRAVRLRLTLSEAASVTFTTRRATSGRRAGGRCVKRTRANAKRRACTRWVTVGRAVRRSLPAGASRLRPAAVLPGRTRAGRHRLLVAPRDAAGNRGAAVSVAFRLR